MKNLNHIYPKIYYRVIDNFIKSKTLSLPPQFAPKRCVFIYYDYEREFGGHKTSITDKDVTEILDIVDKHQIKTNWFTVGKIFEYYPASIRNIQNRGHEIGSHTYNHIAPLTTPNRILEADFETYRQVSRSINSFHSPKGQWSLSCLNLLENYGFLYDVAGLGKNKPELVSLNLGRGKKIMRLYTVGDDYSLLNKKLSDKQVFDYFTTLLRKIDIGCIGGIGFHPWVLFSDRNIFKGFCLFLDYISSQKDITINPAGYYIQLVRTENR